MGSVPASGPAVGAGSGGGGAISGWLPAWWSDDPAAGPIGGRGRSPRDWLVDGCCFLVSLVIGAFAVAGGVFRDQPLAPGWIAADAIVVLLSASALWLRRRWPVGVAMALLPLAAISTAAGIPSAIAGFGVAVHRRLGIAIAIAGLGVIPVTVNQLTRPNGYVPYVVTVLAAAAFGALGLAWGQYVRARRQLVLSLADRAEKAETQQRLRVSQAKRTERTRIAREMHDVLAHRMSLLSMHAGALAFRPDAPAAEISGAAEVIRSSAHEALVDLREIIGVLRETDDDPDGDQPSRTDNSRPQPTVADVPALIAESVRAGDRIEFDNRLRDAGEDVSPAMGRTIYRVLQEALTNVRKHAPGAATMVRLSGEKNAVTVRITNDLPAATGGDGAGENRPSGEASVSGIQGGVPGSILVGGPASIPGSGTGLIGMAERVTLAGGELSYGPDAAGARFQLEVRLPLRS